MEDAEQEIEDAINQEIKAMKRQAGKMAYVEANDTYFNGTLPTVAEANNTIQHAADIATSEEAA